MGGRILVVDDEKRLRDSLTEILESWGHSCAAAGDGQEALALVTASRFDLALVDVRMPVLGGLDLLRRARAASPAFRTSLS